MISRVRYEEADREKLEALGMASLQPFSLESYATAVHAKWYVYFLPSYRGAILIPFSEAGPYQWCATPLFYRASYWLGAWNEVEQKELIERLKSDFVYGDLNIGLPFSVSAEMKIKAHQVIQNEGFTKQYNTQTKRMLKKAERLDVTYKNDFEIEAFLELISQELGSKVESFNTKTLGLLKNLLVSLHQKGLLNLESAWEHETYLGSIAIVRLPGRHLYLKGTATAEAKKNGVFYALMHRSIVTAFEQSTSEGSVRFDFGGSEVAGVAQFNRNFGGEDAHYAALKWGKMPLAVKIGRKLKNLW